MLEHKMHDTEAQKRAKEESFGKFLDLPTTKFILSFIPEGRDADAVKTALRSAFDAGYDAGGAWFVGDLLKTMLSEKLKR